MEKAKGKIVEWRKGRNYKIEEMLKNGKAKKADRQKSEKADRQKGDLAIQQFSDFAKK